MCWRSCCHEQGEAPAITTVTLVVEKYWRRRETGMKELKLLAVWLANGSSLTNAGERRLVEAAESFYPALSIIGSIEHFRSTHRLNTLKRRGPGTKQGQWIHRAEKSGVGRLGGFTHRDWSIWRCVRHVDALARVARWPVPEG